MRHPFIDPLLAAGQKASEILSNREEQQQGQNYLDVYWQLRDEHGFKDDLLETADRVYRVPDYEKLHPSYQWLVNSLMSENPVVAGIERVGGRALENLTPYQSPYYASTGYPTIDTAADIAGTTLGQVAQYMLAGQVAGALGQAAGRIIPQLGRIGQLAPSALRAAGSGAATGAISAGMDALKGREVDLRQVAQNMAWGAGAGLGGQLTSQALHQYLPGINRTLEGTLIGAGSGVGATAAGYPFAETKGVEYLKESAPNILAMAAMGGLRSFLTPEQSFDIRKEQQNARMLKLMREGQAAKQAGDLRLYNAKMRDYWETVNSAWSSYARETGQNVQMPDYMRQNLQSAWDTATSQVAPQPPPQSQVPPQVGTAQAQPQPQQTTQAQLQPQPVAPAPPQPVVPPVQNVVPEPPPQPQPVQMPKVEVPPPPAPAPVEVPQPQQPQQNVIPPGSQPQQKFPDVGYYSGDLSDWTPILYQETGAYGASAFIPTAYTTANLKEKNVYLANVPELASGQSEGKGILLEFSSDGLLGEVNTLKPSWKMLYDKDQAEFFARGNDQQQYLQNLRRITIKPGAFDNESKGTRRKFENGIAHLVKQGWVKTQDEQGNIIVTRPDVASYEANTVKPEQTVSAPSVEVQQPAPPAPTPPPQIGQEPPWVSVSDHWEDRVSPQSVKPTHATAETRGVIKLSAIENLAGAKGEVRAWNYKNGKLYFGNYTEAEWNAFVNDIRENGVKEPVYIHVQMDGTPVVYEGNHRIAAAKEAGITEVPARIRYLGNSQDIVHDFDYQGISTAAEPALRSTETVLDSQTPTVAPTVNTEPPTSSLANDSVTSAPVGTATEPAASPATNNDVGRVTPTEVAVTKQKPFSEMDTEELVSFVKSLGKERQASYGQFAKYRNLKPEINAKEFNRIWDQVSASNQETREVVSFTPTHVLKGSGVKVMVTKDDGVNPVKYVTEYGAKGSNPRAYWNDEYVTALSEAVPTAEQPAQPANVPLTNEAPQRGNLLPNREPLAKVMKASGEVTEYAVGPNEKVPHLYSVYTRTINDDGTKGSWISGNTPMARERALEIVSDRVGNARYGHSEVYDSEIQAIMNGRTSQKQAEIDTRKKEQAEQTLAHDQEQRARVEMLSQFEKAKFKKATVSVPIKNSSKETIETETVTGPSYGGLIVHKLSYSQGWHVTHAGSGLSVAGKSYPTQKEAKLVAWRLSQLGDFTKGKDEIIAEFKGISEPLKEIANDPYNARLSPDALKFGKVDTPFELDEVQAELRAEVDALEARKEVAAERGSITLPGGRKVKESEYAFPEEIEQRYQAAKSIPEPTLVDRVKNAVGTVHQGFTRVYTTLPRTAEFAPLMHQLLKLEKQRGVAADNTIMSLRGITSDLDKETADLFERRVLLEDLMEDLDKGLPLPLGFTPESLQAEYDKLQNKVSSPEVDKAIAKRTKLWDALKEAYITAMEDIGFDVRDRFTRENYFRHLVLEHMNEIYQSPGGGKRLRTPTYQGFLKSREGTEGDIATNYLHAEYEVMAKMLYDMERAKTIKFVDEKYNQIDRVKDLAKDMTEERIQQKREAGWYELNAGDTVRPVDRDNLGTIISINGDRAQVYFHNKAKGTEDTVEFPLTDLIPNDKAGEVKVDWHNAIPEGYTTWQPREGSVFYMVDTLPAKLAHELLSGAVSELGITSEDLGRALAIGRKRKEFVVKQEVADTLNELFVSRPTGPVGKAGRKINNAWKKMVLTHPRRVVKYNLRNISGDADALFVGNPSAFKKAPRAIKELYQLYKKKTMTADMRDWFERGGMQSLLQVQELNELDKLSVFNHIREDNTNLVKKTWNSIWGTTRGATDFREAILRYAAYLDYLEQIKANGGTPNNFGASIREEVMAIEDYKDRAYKLSNELLGAYDQVSPVGKELRDKLVPFYSFMEINAKRYVQLAKNAAIDGDIAHKAARGLLGKAAFKSPFMAMKIGKFILKAAGLATVVEVWNRTMFPKEEERLKGRIGGAMHIIYGVDKEGEALYLDRLGGLQEFLEWFGMDAAPSDVADLLNGKRTLKEIATDMALSPIDKAYSSMLPIPKAIIEGTLGWKSWPKPTKIRDKAEYVASQFSLDNEYRLLAGKPMSGGGGWKGYGYSWLKALVTKIDLDEADYYQTLDLKRKWELDTQGKYSTYVVTEDPKSAALYNYKAALRYGDTEAAKRYLLLYVEYGGTERGYEQSMKMLHPLYGLDNKEKNDFLSSLSNREKEAVEYAVKYYDELMRFEKTVKTQKLPTKSKKK